MEYIRPLDGTLPSEFQKRNEEPAKIAEQDGFSELSDADAADGAKVFEPEDNSKDTPTIDELEAKAQADKQPQKSEKVKNAALEV